MHTELEVTAEVAAITAKRALALPAPVPAHASAAPTHTAHKVVALKLPPQKEGVGASEREHHTSAAGPKERPKEQTKERSRETPRLPQDTLANHHTQIFAVPKQAGEVKDKNMAEKGDAKNKGDGKAEGKVDSKAGKTPKHPQPKSLSANSPPQPIPLPRPEASETSAHAHKHLQRAASPPIRTTRPANSSSVPMAHDTESKAPAGNNTMTSAVKTSAAPLSLLPPPQKTPRTLATTASKDDDKVRTMEAEQESGVSA